MEKILEKIDKHSLELYLLAGDLLIKASASKDDKESHRLSEASEVLQNISIALKNTWSELKEIKE